MVKQILTAAGFIEGETFKETRFLRPPKSTYAVYHDSVNRRGADNLNCITEHNVSIELYSQAPDPDAESRIEASIDQIGRPFTKDERYWIESEQLYQVIYTLNYINTEIICHE